MSPQSDSSLPASPAPATGLRRLAKIAQALLLLPLLVAGISVLAMQSMHGLWFGIFAMWLCWPLGFGLGLAAAILGHISRRRPDPLASAHPERTASGSPRVLTADYRFAWLCLLMPFALHFVLMPAQLVLRGIPGLYFVCFTLSWLLPYGYGLVLSWRVDRSTPLYGGRIPVRTLALGLVMAVPLAGAFRPYWWLWFR